MKLLQGMPARAIVKVLKFNSMFNMTKMLMPIMLIIRMHRPPREMPLHSTYMHGKTYYRIFGLQQRPKNVAVSQKTVAESFRNGFLYVSLGPVAYSFRQRFCNLQQHCYKTVAYIIILGNGCDAIKQQQL